jgi:hypothetical protein
LIKENKQKVVYTCLTGDYDNLMRLSYVDNDWDYVCFTDNQSLLKKKRKFMWDIRPLLFDRLDNSKNQRWHKVNVLDIFPQYEESIYIDANINILTPYLFDTVKNSNTDILVPLHIFRDCVYEELDAVISKKKDDEKVCRELIEYIKSKGFPSHYGLSENNIMYRRHVSCKIKKIMPEWWQLIENYSTRDQLSFTYVLWNNGIRVQDISFPCIKFDYTNFFIEYHKNRLKNHIFYKRNLRNGKSIIYVMGKRIFSF